MLFEKSSMPGDAISSVPDQNRITVGGALGMAGAVLAILFSAVVFALLATIATDVFLPMKEPLDALLFFAFYWGLFARLMLLAVKKGFLISRQSDLSLPPEERLAPWERRVLGVFLLNAIRIEFVVSTALLILVLADVL